MTKIFLKYFLCFLLLLSNLFSQAYASYSQEFIHLEYAQNGHHNSIKQLLRTTGQNDRVNSVDDEDEDKDENKEDDKFVLIIKKYLEAGNYFTVAFFQTETPLLHSQSVKNQLISSKYSAHSQTQRYLMYRVLRI